MPLLQEWSAWTRPVLVLLAAFTGGLVIHVALSGIATRLARAGSTLVRLSLVRRVQGPSRLLLPLLCVHLALPAAGFGGEVQAIVQHGLSIGLILLTAWLLIATIEGVEEQLLVRHDIAARDNLRARKVHTQLRVLTRTLDIVIVVVAVAAVLMTFPRVRQIGASLLASAGIAGIVVGFAARPTVSNLIAGLQIALAEPIRLDDVVIVEGEWGRVEEITSTYVVIKVWDERRMIVPLTWFLENTFQNWTRTSADLLGTVFLHVDYELPVEELRAELTRICEASDLWDRRVCRVHVTDCTERTVQVRALVSAADSGKLWDLRCLVREELIAFVRREHPKALPRLRAELEESRRSARRGPRHP